MGGLATKRSDPQTTAGDPAEPRSPRLGTARHGTARFSPARIVHLHRELLLAEIEVLQLPPLEDLPGEGGGEAPPR